MDQRGSASAGDIGDAGSRITPKKSFPSRSEITDAAMGERAECVMLN
jgi:hypothetical protein